MAKKYTDSNGRAYVVVEKGDTLSQIAKDYLGAASKYKQLAAINGITNPDKIYIGRKIYLTASGSSSAKKTTSSNMAKITDFGLQSDVDNTVFAVWTWSKDKTEHYETQWKYYTRDKVWFIGSDTTTKYKYSTFSIPEEATKIVFRVRPIAKKQTLKKADKSTYEKAYWTAEWTAWQEFYPSALPPETPATPTVKIEKLKLTASLDNIKTDPIAINTATKYEFQIIKNDTKVFKTAKANANLTTLHVEYSCSVEAGSEYKVRCRAIDKQGNASGWSAFSSNEGTPPAASGGIITLKALSETSVYIDWENVKNAKTYEIEYATKKMYFDSSSEVKKTTVDGTVAGHAEITGMESGEEYFFRVRAVNDKGASAWTPIQSIKIGKKPAAPTTWSSATTVVTGEPLTLYWVHNSQDGSSQTYAKLEIIVGDKKTEYSVANTTDEEEKDKASKYVVDTSGYTEGTKIQWRVRTRGVTNEYSDWSVQRTVDIYSPPTLELDATDKNGGSINPLLTFPFYVEALAGPNTQTPISYHLSIVSNSNYDTVDEVGNDKTVSQGDIVYSKNFDISDKLIVEFSAGNIDLQNGAEYTITCVVSMNSGLTADASLDLKPMWVEASYVPNAEVGIDETNYTATIRPYCEEGHSVYYKVTKTTPEGELQFVYTKTDEVIEDYIWGEELTGIFTETGEQVFFGMTAAGEETEYCVIDEYELVEGVSLSVYRRESDGAFTEIATDLNNTEAAFITDPHPSLDYARYRIVATTIATGAVAYYDLPSIPVGGKAIIIQWDEQWSTYNATDITDPMADPPWTGSLLKLPYNIDVSDKNSPDITLANYIGRKHPVAYYGTQRGEAQTWNAVFEKADEETLYTLRRLKSYTGNVYVREPSGTGYWATVNVSYNLKHCDPTVPVTFEITRVEGGV